MSSSSESDRPRVARPRRSREGVRRGRSNSSKVPVTIRYGLPLAVLVVLIWQGLAWWQGGRRVLVFVDPAGAELRLEDATVQLFDYDDSPSAAWPTPPRGEPRTFSGNELVLSDLPGPTIARIDSSVYGVGFGYAEPGQGRERVRVGPPLPIRVRVLSHEDQPLAGARVEVLGGGPRGVRLAQGVSDADGALVVDRIWGTIKALCFRAYAPGHAVYENDTFVDHVSELEIGLEASRPVQGQIALGPGVAHDALDFGSLSVQAFHVPGVGTPIEADGSFTIGHLPPPPKRIPLLLAGLPEGLTHRRTLVVAGERSAELQVMPASVVQGRVINGHTGMGVKGCRVFQDHGPDGMEVAVTDADGAFTLRRVPPGPVTVGALIRVARRALSPAALRRHPGDGRFVDIEGRVRLNVVPGQAFDEQIIEVW